MIPFHLLEHITPTHYRWSHHLHLVMDVLYVSTVQIRATHDHSLPRSITRTAVVLPPRQLLVIMGLLGTSSIFL